VWIKQYAHLKEPEMLLTSYCEISMSFFGAYLSENFKDIRFLNLVEILM